MTGAGERFGQASPRQRDWELRPYVLGGILALCGLAIYFFSDGGETPWRMAGAAFFAFAGIAAAFTLEPDDWKEPALFALVVGLVMAGLAFNAVDLGDRVAGEEYSFAAGVFASLLAVPLFQAGFHRTRFKTPYRETHYHVWTDAVSGGGAVAFTGLSWVVLALLSQLFKLIDIDLLEELMEEESFGWTFSGAAFGAALGVIRNQLKVLGTLQSVVLLVLSLLAVPLAVALVLFLIPLALSGGQVLWDATRSPTPVLLASAAGAFVLVNSVIRDSDDSSSRSRIMRIAAAVLAFGVFPLALFAAISMGTRIGQYGLAPERIWGMVAIAVALAYGLAYWFGLARGRAAGWAEQLRRANLNLAAAVCVLALFLATPVLNFGAISTADQLGRLARGDVSAEDFDYQALRWDFGKPGRETLERLAQGEDAEIAELAQEALDSDTRIWRGMDEPVRASVRQANLRRQFDSPELAEAFADLIRREPWRCQAVCTALDLGKTPNGKQHAALVEAGMLAHFLLDAEQGLVTYYPGAAEPDPFVAADGDGPADAHEPRVELREVGRRQVYVDGKPLGNPFE